MTNLSCSSSSVSKGTVSTGDHVLGDSLSAEVKLAKEMAGSAFNLFHNASEAIYDGSSLGHWGQTNINFKWS